VAYGSKELAESFRTVRRNTVAAAKDIPADKYDFVPAEGCKSVEKLLAHIALSYRFQHQIHGADRQSSLEGFDFGAVMAKLGAEEAKPRTKDEVIALLEKEGELWAGFLDGLSDDLLSERVSFSPAVPSKSRLEMIMSVKEHEMHHRGQVMLIQRLLGGVPHLTRERQARMAQANT